MCAHDTATVRDRLATVSARTGLSPAELGVARLYPDPAPPTVTESGTAPLAGVPVLVKDLNLVAGEVTTYGSAAHAVHATADDAAVRALRATGAVLVGASSAAEFGATAYTEPVGTPWPVNPLGAGYMPGGSSGGAATAVGHGVVDVAHATDGGGSIRVPAACCGLPGLKPAHSVVTGGGSPGAGEPAAPAGTTAAAPGVTPTAQGFIARDLAWTARAYGLPAPSAAQPGRTRPLRIAHTNTPFHCAVTAGGAHGHGGTGHGGHGHAGTGPGDPGVVPSTTDVDPVIAAATAAAAVLATRLPQVSSVVPLPAPYPPALFETFADVLASRCAGLPDPLLPVTAWFRDRGRAVTDADPDRGLAAATRTIAALPDEVLRAWPDVDVAVTPTLACAPPPPGTFSALSPAADVAVQTAWTPWATLWNLTGWAALTVPLVDPADVPGRWPVSVHLGAVGDRATAADLLDLAEGIVAQIRASGMNPEYLSVDGPGDPLGLGAAPTPRGHDHAGPCGCGAGVHRP
ncbi:amidase family protein [Corynebacterium bovis]|uniref:amidase n=2 Tax=Corynebacterium bovis TaxID=36808 RepID=A0A3R8PEA7_9CORY|nr:amidase [Corynebacterium bovis]RRO88874.1 amidase [Corynebacterium bovis]RRO99593.1 amidase [Corynebacterium bovis]RRQ01496.1 amidase [Corynebacterium bovis]RRQ06337.1 amidase [Corynebacterium bovis]RRQ10535.1 amidase [Corynebacterium bovis]